MILATSWASDLTYLLKERLGIDLGADIYSEYILAILEIMRLYRVSGYNMR